jgi:rRNA maturation endonuclease Nob1
MADLKMHYALEGISKSVSDFAIFAFRCGDCHHDFHIDKKPEFCPECGAKFTREVPFGRVPAAMEAKR